MSKAMIKILALSTISIVILAYAGFAGVKAWTEPSDVPTRYNIDEPVNVGVNPQNKFSDDIAGTLMISNVNENVVFSISSVHQTDNKTVYFRIADNVTNGPTYVDWVLPSTAGGNGQVLTIENATGNVLNLKWSDAHSLPGSTKEWEHASGETYDQIPKGYPSGVFTKFFAKVIATLTAKGDKTSWGPGDLYVEKELEVDGMSNFDNTVIVGKTASNVNPELRLGSGVDYWSLIGNEIGSGELFFSYKGVKVAWDKTGKMTTGIVPWARLDPAVKTCLAGESIIGSNSNGLICGFGGVTNGTDNQTLRWDGASGKWLPNNSLLVNNSGKVAINKSIIDTNYILDVAGFSGAKSRIDTGLETQNINPIQGSTYQLGSATKTWSALYLDGLGSLYIGMSEGAIPYGNAVGSLSLNQTTFKFDRNNNTLLVGGADETTGVGTAISSRGNILPSANNIFDLGSEQFRWKNLFVSKLNIFDFKPGSVIFQGAEGLAQNNDNFHWNDANQSLSLGSKNNINNFQLLGPEIDGIGAVATNGTTVSCVGYCRFMADLAPGSELIILDQVRIVTKIVDNKLMYINAPFDFTANGINYRYKNRSFAIESYKSNNSEATGRDGLYLSGIYDELYQGGWGSMASVYIGNKIFMHNAGKDITLPLEKKGDNYYFSNTFLGSEAGFSQLNSFLQKPVAEGEIQTNPYFPTASLTGLGYKSMYQSGPSEASTGVGSYSLFHNANDFNTAVGAYAMYSNDTGLGNTAIGHQALYRYKGSEYGDDFEGNVAVGNGALFSNTTGSNNIAIGTKAGYGNLGSNNIFIGYKVGFSQFTGDNNFVVSNSDTGPLDSLLYGRLRQATTNDKPFLRINSELQFGVSDERFNMPPYNNAVRGLSDQFGICIPGNTSSTEIFLVNGAIICTQYLTSCAEAGGTTLKDCCLKQLNGCGY